MSVFSGFSYLRKVASAIAQKSNVKVKYTDMEGQETQADMTTNTVLINESDAYLYGDDFVIGNLLHEIGHLQHTPRDLPNRISDAAAKNQHNVRVLHTLTNLLEDWRIEAIIKAKMSGARYYLSELREPLLADIEKQLARKAMPCTARDDKTALQQIVKAIRTQVETPRVSPADLDRYAVNLAKKFVLRRILAASVLIAENREVTQLQVTEWQRAAQMLADMQTEAMTTKDVLPMALDAYKVIAPWISDEERGSHSSVMAMQSLLKLGGHIPTDTPSDEKINSSERNRYPIADANAKPLVDSLKRKLIAKMRDNQHQRFIGNKRRGLLDKKSLHRVARKNYLVYRKRQEVKGKHYSVSVILDTSGSMWEGGGTGQTIDRAMTASALLVRTFRALGFRASLTIFGSKPKTLVAHNALYMPDKIADAIGGILESDGVRDYYQSHDNVTSRAFAHALPTLAKQQGEKIVVMVTDGGLSSDDIARSKDLLKKYQSKGIAPVILYVGQGAGVCKILNDPSKETDIPETEHLVEHVASLLAKIQV